MNTHTLRSLIIGMASIISLLAMPLAAAAVFPTGTYKAGEVSIRFDAQGHFKLSQGDKTLVDGKFTASGDQLKVTDESGSWACSKKGEETGSYRWSFESETLTFSKLDDQCAGRSDDLPKRKWKRED
jgi:hypothetical protein